MALIKIDSLKKNFGKIEVLNGITLEVNKLEQCVVQGSSGSGKSTLLYLIGGLDRDYSGHLEVNGEQMEKLSDKELAKYRNRFVGFIFQFHFLLPSLSCLENILMPARLAGENIKEIEEFIRGISERLKISHCLSRYPFELSGGEQQRVNIVRALSLKPSLLLCDEPAGNLDSVNSTRVVELIKELCDEFSSTLLLVTHDQSIASSFKRTVTIRDGIIA